MQTRDDDRVFVVGVANGREPILHVAKEQGLLAADNILAHASGDALEPHKTTHHHVIFSRLGVVSSARVGHSAASAAAADLDVVSATPETHEDGVFLTKEVPYRRATLVADATDGAVLGYQRLRYHADVMAETMQVAVETGMDAREIPDRAYHPTTPEIIDGLLR